MVESRASRALDAALAEVSAWRELYAQSQQMMAFWRDVAEGRNPLTGEPACSRCRGSADVKGGE